LKRIRTGGAAARYSRRWLSVGIAVVSLTVLTGAASARVDSGQRPSAKTQNIQVGVLLPDTKSSVRWETQDRRFLAAAFEKAGIEYTIVNAEGSAQKQRAQAEQALTNGAKVLLLVNLDSGSGRAIQTLATARGAKVIDYDRLTLKGKTAYYVSFNNVQVGRLMGAGIVAALRAKGTFSKKPVVAELNGSPTDNNATLFKQGYDSVLTPLYKKGTFTKGPDQSVPQWDNQKALTIFEQMLSSTSNKIDAVAAANDGLANAVITALKARKLKQIPVSGQDATAQGIQNVISGWQSGSVYKSIKLEADAAAKLAIALAKGQKPAGVNGKTNDGTRDVPSVLLKPVWITKSNYTLLFKEGFLKKNEVCRGTYAKFCK
jgi:D-xylose transport system substrate-binding protein